MSDLTVIILTYNEELHIERCIKSINGLGARIVVVDSFSTDGTSNMVKCEQADFYENKFVNQAKQFQWAMNNCEIDSEWVLRLDADETIDEEMCRNIKQFVEKEGNGHNGAILNRKHIFLGKWVRWGGRYPLPMLRLFRKGTAHIEQRWMDEHIVLDEGTSTVLEGGFYDDNLNPISWFIDKHNKYATREMVDIMLKRIYPEEESIISNNTGLKIKIKRYLKQSVYMKLPYFFRPFLYFVYRYLLQLGFLDGPKGFAYHFMQGFWYRALVDLKCLELEKAWNKCNTHKEKLEALEKLSGYSLSKE